MNNRRLLLALGACLLPALALAAAPEIAQAPSLESYQAQVGDRETRIYSPPAAESARIL